MDLGCCGICVDIDSFFGEKEACDENLKSDCVLHDGSKKLVVCVCVCDCLDVDVNVDALLGEHKDSRSVEAGDNPSANETPLNAGGYMSLFSSKESLLSIDVASNDSPTNGAT